MSFAWASEQKGIISLYNTGFNNTDTVFIARYKPSPSAFQANPSYSSSGNYCTRPGLTRGTVHVVHCT